MRADQAREANGNVNCHAMPQGNSAAACERVIEESCNFRCDCPRIPSGSPENISNHPSQAASQSKHPKNFLLGSINLGWLPIVAFLKRYKSEYLKYDLAAGFSVGVSAIPMGMSYALLADVPPIHGLYSNFFYCFVYMFLGSCNQCAVGTSAIEAMMAAEAVSRLTGHQPSLAERLQTMSTLAFFVGVTFLLFRAVKMGTIVSRFLSEPILNGLSTGAALNIAIAQINSVLGIPQSKVSQRGIRGRCLNTWVTLRNIRQINWYSLAISTTTIVLLSVAKEAQVYISRRATCSCPSSNRKFDVSSPTISTVETATDEVRRGLTNDLQSSSNNPEDCSSRYFLPLPAVYTAGRDIGSHAAWPLQFLFRVLCKILCLPGPLLVLIMFLVAGQIYPLEGFVSTVGTVTGGFVRPRFPLYNLKLVDSELPWLANVFVEAVWYSFVVLAIHLAVTQTFAGHDGYVAKPCQECIALGFAGVIGSCFGCLPIATSISRSAIARTAGAKTPLFHISNMACLLIATTLLGPMLRLLPLSCLAAVVVFSVRRMAQPWRPLVLLRGGYRSDALVWVVAAAATLAAGAMHGLLAGVLMALGCLLRKTAYPDIQSTLLLTQEGCCSVTGKEAIEIVPSKSESSSSDDGPASCLLRCSDSLHTSSNNERSLAAMLGTNERILALDDGFVQPPESCQCSAEKHSVGAVPVILRIFLLRVEAPVALGVDPNFDVTVAQTLQRLANRLDTEGHLLLLVSPKQTTHNGIAPEGMIVASVPAALASARALHLQRS